MKEPRNNIIPGISGSGMVGSLNSTTREAEFAGIDPHIRNKKFFSMPEFLMQFSLGKENRIGRVRYIRSTLRKP